MSGQEMSLPRFLAILRRRLALLLLLPLLAAVGAALISLYLVQPVYEASTTLWVIKGGSDQIDYNTLMLNRNLTSTYGEVAKSRAVMRQTLEQVELPGLTEEGLQKLIRVTPVHDTEIMSISVEYTDPVAAATLANTVAGVFKAQIQSFLRVDNVAVVDPAMPPLKPVKPHVPLNVAAAALLGVITAVALAFLLEQVDQTVKTPSDIQQLLGLPTLAAVPVMRAVRVPAVTPPRAEVPPIVEGEVVQ